MKLLLLRIAKVVFIGCLVVLISGCTVVLQKRHTSDVEQIKSLSTELKRLKMTEEQLGKLKQAYTALEKSLNKEIGENKVNLDIQEKGLVITFIDSVLFNSGKAKLRSQSFRTLDKVVSVAQRVVADREIGIEGHTDNQPIKHSGWKSNWELSIARATSVLHYLIKKGISPERLSATGFGEFRPLAANDSPKSRLRNRRVEIVILPEKTTKVKGTASPRPASGEYVK